MNKEIKFLEEHCEFNNLYDCYVLLAVSRKKDTPEITNSQEVVFREVLRKTEDIKRKFQRLKLNCENYRDDKDKKYPFYIYITCNQRNGKKASKMVMEKLLDCFYEESLGNDRSRIFKRLDREFISTLMKKESRGSTRYFMIDVDTKDPEFIIKISDKLGDEIIQNYKIIETRNGYHIKTQPFNIQEFNKQFTHEELNGLVEVKTDGLLFVKYLENKDIFGIKVEVDENLKENEWKLK